MKKFKKIVIVPCKLDDGGRIISKNMRAPYGYHHVIGIYHNTGEWLIATIDSFVTEEKLKDIVKVMAGEIPVEIEREYYSYKKAV